MVFVYALLKVEDKAEEALQVLQQADRITVPDSVRAELANVVWQWVKFKGVSEAIAFEVIQDAESLFDDVISSERLWVEALQLAITADHPVYDTLFLVAAATFDDFVVTYDKKMLARFPTQAISAADALKRLSQE
ncbi:MAG: type II toxin-antitoxin system VapC family toxin [Cyanobacteria bacterium P01_A01_bin.116]